MQKEILTIEQCRQELIRVNRPTVRYILVFVMMGLFCTAFFDGLGVLINFACKSNLVWWIVSMAMLSIPPLMIWIVLIVSLVRAHRMIRRVQTQEMEMVEDLLLSAYEDGEIRGRDFNLFYVLNFRDHGKHRVFEGLHYGWSKLYAMSDRGIYNTSIPGDEFYILRWKEARQEELIYIFNKKYFELCPDGTERKSTASWRDSVSVE